MSFYVTGSGDEDALIVDAVRFSGRIVMQLPAAAMPWRDLARVEKLGPRPWYGCCDVGEDDWRNVRAKAQGEEVEDRTGLRNAEAVVIAGNVATIEFSSQAPLVFPCLRVAEAARLPVALRVQRIRAADKGLPELRVLQLSGGRRVGGVTLVISKEGKKVA